MPDTETPGEVARFYTRARKFPKLIGRLHDGTRIPGGPYTMSQIVALVTLTTGGMLTRGWWGTTVLFDLILSIAVGVGGAILLGLLPAQQRNLFSVAGGLVRATGSSAVGRYNGRSVQLSPPSHATGRVAINTAPALASDVPDVDPDQPPEPRTTPEEAPAPVRPVAVSGVERLLLQTKK